LPMPVSIYLIDKDLITAYRQMAQEEAREVDALEWVEATVGDATGEALNEWVSPLQLKAVSGSSPTAEFSAAASTKRKSLLHTCTQSPEANRIGFRTR
jgi:hypothetical protein